MQKLQRAFYDNTIEKFLSEDDSIIYGSLTKNNQFTLLQEQQRAWESEVSILKKELKSFHGHILFEYTIPRVGKRADIILLINQSIFVLEFKVGSSIFDRGALDQVMDYALDLKNFHEGSANLAIYPLLIATANTTQTSNEALQQNMKARTDNVYNALKVAPSNLSAVLHFYLSKKEPSDTKWQKSWVDSNYHPTPTIIEAAQALYAGHSVTEISRSDAGAINLTKTTDAIKESIAQSQENNQKTICFITGVPGAGKTLAGLNIANSWHDSTKKQHAVFLSGNGPLVSVLRESLSRDEMQRSKQFSIKLNKKDCERKVSAFIQNIHHFRDEMLKSKEAPLEKVVIFDEAQRAWDKEQASSFMQKKRNIPDFSISEPEFLLSIMDRHEDWAVIICLIGGGQEINKGEGGIGEWYQALHSRFSHWNVSISSNLCDSEYLIGDSIHHLEAIQNKTWKPELHLSTSIRSFRSEKVSEMFKRILDREKEHAKNLLQEVKKNYPIVLTRDIHLARNWLREQARGSERYGLMASSSAQRLKPLGINVKNPINEVYWFLNNKEDIRSSYYLEDVTTEFQTQGLELDWTGLIWDADFRFHKGTWEYWQFRGKAWQKINKESNQRYLKNAYRVLLTRARQGIVIVVPYGSEDDHTRNPTFYDETYDYLAEIGFDKI